MNYALKFKYKKIIAAILVLIPLVGNTQVYKENALLWKVSGNGLEQSSYVFGIVKFIPDSDYFLPSKVIEVLEKSKILSTETLLDHHAKHELNKAAHLPDNKSIDEFLTKLEYEELKAIFHDKLDISQLKFNLIYKKFKPIMLSTTMTRLALKEDARFYEFELISKANEKGMVTVGLETVDREVQALEKFTLEDQVDALKHTIANFEKQVEDYKELIAAYKAGNLHKTLEYTLHPVEHNKDFKKYFIFERNKEWLPKMVGYMQQAPTFFAIGTSHLADEEGLIHLLVEAGYTVEPISTD